MCDCDLPAAHSEYFPTARKEHKCCECQRTIKPGERYQLYSGVWEGAGMSFKTCRECHAIREAIKDGLSQGDCGPCFTQLGDAIADSGMTREQWLAAIAQDAAA